VAHPSVSFSFPKPRAHQNPTGLTADHRLLFELIRREGQFLGHQLWKAYLLRCNRIGRKPLSSRTYSDYVNTLIESGLVTSERARMRGRVRLLSARR
jgi:hypothetical protein